MQKLCEEYRALTLSVYTGTSEIDKANAVEIKHRIERDYHHLMSYLHNGTGANNAVPKHLFLTHEAEAIIYDTVIAAKMPRLILQNYLFSDRIPLVNLCKDRWIFTH